jgi:hypothetical protein
VASAEILLSTALCTIYEVALNLEFKDVFVAKDVSLRLVQELPFQVFNSLSIALCEYLSIWE